MEEAVTVHVSQCQGLQSILEVFFRKNPTN